MSGPRTKRPRRLRFTREGQVVVAIALGVGFAAINTGHNLLYFGWGLVLSAIVTSGVLSEATIWSLRARPRRPDELRARSLSPLPLLVENPRKHLPALGVELDLSLRCTSDATDDVATREAAAPSVVAAPYLLRLGPGQDETLLVPWVPARRGRYVLEEARARTTYPFGFFEKSRRLRFREPLDVVVYPARVELGPLARTLLSRFGEVPSGRKGLGDEYFSLRPFVSGDDPRSVAWRRSARTGRLVVKETEAHGAREVVLELMFPEVSISAGPRESAEDALAALGSLAEDLLAAGAAVGVRTAGVSVPPGTGPRQRAAVLLALAGVRPLDAMPVEDVSARAARVALTFPGWPVAGDAEHVIDLADAFAGDGRAARSGDLASDASEEGRAA